MNFKKTLLALLLTLTLLFTLTIPAFATEVTDSGSNAEVTGEAAEPTESDSETVADGQTTAADTDGETEPSADTTEASTNASDTTATDEGMSVGDWISIGIGAAILLVLIVLAILFITAKDDPEIGKNGGKVPFKLRGKRFFRSCKSEASKIVWTPWKTVRKNTLVVLIVLVLCALLIGLLDWVFSGGINALAGLF